MTTTFSATATASVPSPLPSLLPLTFVVSLASSPPQGSKFSFSSGFKSMYDLFSEWKKIELDSWPALPNELFIGGWASQNLSIPWKEVESKLFVLNAVADVIIQDGQTYDFSVVMRDKRLVLTIEDLSKALREVDPEISLSLKQSPTSYTQVLNAASRGLHRYA
ncbi:hypothetical protein Fmac_008904 [Flemingia macrophylla]|uniref:Uncharacterized protein n=1 Tax=Flemingia macrophylla TaxID=520843 RepID=A0ABD1MYT2_9FABA